MLVIRAAAVGPLGANCYLVGCDETREALLVDPGGDIARVEALREPGGYRIVRILCTHGHVDHVAGAAEARERFKAPLQLHAADRDWLVNLSAQAAMFGLGEPQVPTVDHEHTDGERLSVGKHEARILHTPGHSRGSVCLYFEQDQVAFTGDTLFAGSVGRTDLPGGDYGELERSICERLFPLGDAVRFFPGHGRGALLGEERLSNPFVGERARRSRFL
jgi:hydroxyacylglutathione hydrolase